VAKFLFVYRRGRDLGDTITPEQMQQTLQKWSAWIGEGLANGWILEPGDALTQQGRVVRPMNIVTDGPFIESKEIVGGYSVIQAESIEAASELAKGCPGLQSGGSVEVRPLAGFAIQK
jgi:hypothetical protein